MSTFLLCAPDDLQLLRILVKQNKHGSTLCCMSPHILNLRQTFLIFIVFPRRAKSLYFVRGGKVCRN